MSGNMVISEASTVAKSDGSFKAVLPAVMAGGPYTLEFTSASASKTVNDILVGELWIQCGQKERKIKT